MNEQNGMFKLILTAAFFAAAVFLWSSAYSDVIYFKDGGKIEGVIQEEDDAGIIINLGVGTMAVRRDEIERIEQSSEDDEERMEEENRADMMARGEWAPIGCEAIRTAYLRSKESRESFKKVRNKSAGAADAITQKEEKTSELLKVLDDKGKALKTIDSKKHTREYNDLVGEMNSISAQLNAENNELKALYAEQKNIAESLIERANKYRGNFQSFKDALKEKEKESGANDAQVSSDEAAFLDKMLRNMAELDNDFKKDTVGYTAEGNQVVVDALINGISAVRLVVDTGASIVVISREVADSLMVPEEGSGEEIEVVMANGTAARARPIILKSIRVGDAEVRNVPAAILEGGVVGGADGLLGMSFLSNFIISVDAASNKLIFEQVL